MQESLLDIDPDGDHGPLAVDLGLRQQRLVADDGRLAVDPEGVVESRDEEQQADRRVLHDVAHGVEPVVARAVRDDQRTVVEHLDEAGRIAARRDVGAAALAAGPDAQEGRPGDEVAAVAIERGQRLADRQIHRRAEEIAQPAFVVDPTVRRIAIPHELPPVSRPSAAISSRHSRLPSPLFSTVTVSPPSIRLTAAQAADDSVTASSRCWTNAPWASGTQRCTVSSIAAA